MGKKINRSFILFSLVLAVILLLFLNTVPGQKKLEINPLFSDHMVLQQNQEVAFWGNYSPNKKIKITATWGSEATTKVDNNGNWKLSLNTPNAGGPFEIKIKSNDSSILLKDIMIGEVWLASGQSNMTMPLKGWPPDYLVENYVQEIADADFPAIRMFTVGKNISAMPQNNLKGEWKLCAPETAGDFSATAYFFARRLYQELNIPIGIIHSSWGGTPIEAWTSFGQLETVKDIVPNFETEDDPKLRSSKKEWVSSWNIKQVPTSDSAWSSIDFADLAAAKNNFNDEEWLTVELPNSFEKIGLGDFDGVVWFRKTIEMEDISTDYALSLGAVDDMDVTYFNGHKVGATMGLDKSQLQRVYTVPKAIVQKGKNTIAIRMIDTGGAGGFSSENALLISNNNSSSISLAGAWKLRTIGEIFNEGNFYIYGFSDKNNLRRYDSFVNLTPKTPNALFNGMIHPIVPYTVKGVVFYQGEASVNWGALYEQLFPLLINDWRMQWNVDFPFYFVQIAPFKYNNRGDLIYDVSQKLREAQRHALSIKNTGMVVTMDIGDYAKIHPANKQDVGARLAGLALANNYGKNIVASGPLYKSHVIKGNKLILDFTFKGTGLIAKNEKLVGFEIAGTDKKFIPAIANIVADKIEVYAPALANPAYVRYAWRDQGVASLFNKEGLPASSFTSEY